MTTLKRLHTGSQDSPALVFVHGLGGHPIDTWRHESCAEADFWLHWLGADTNCDVWSLGYDAALAGWTEQAMPLARQGDQVLERLSSASGLSGRNLVLIGHSMGGLVIKKALISGRTKGDAGHIALTERIRGVVFIATPHSGSQLARLAKAVKLLLRTNEQVGNLAAHDPALGELNQQFRHAVDAQGLRVKVFAEERGLPIQRFHSLVQRVGSR